MSWVAPRVVQVGAGASAGVEVQGGVRHSQVAARRHGVHQPGDDLVRAAGVRDELHDGQQDNRNRLAEVERPGGFVQDLLRVARVGL